MRAWTRRSEVRVNGIGNLPGQGYSLVVSGVSPSKRPCGVGEGANKKSLNGVVEDISDVKTGAKHCISSTSSGVREKPLNRPITLCCCYDGKLRPSLLPNLTIGSTQHMVRVCQELLMRVIGNKSHVELTIRRAQISYVGYSRSECNNA